MTKVLSKWYIHISLLLVTTITFCVSVNMKTAPKEDERVSFFVGAIDTKKDDLEAKLDSKCDDDILAIYYHFHNIYASNFTFIYSSFRENCDFFILPINYVNDYKGATINYSANLDIEYLNDYLINNYSKYFDEMNIIGITGTNGKTTTSYLLYQALNKLGKKCAYIGTLGYFLENGKVKDLPNTKSLTRCF